MVLQRCMVVLQKTNWRLSIFNSLLVLNFRHLSYKLTNEGANVQLFATQQEPTTRHNLRSASSSRAVVFHCFPHMLTIEHCSHSFVQCESYLEATTKRCQ